MAALGFLDGLRPVSSSPAGEPMRMGGISGSFSPPAPGPADPAAELAAIVGRHPEALRELRAALGAVDGGAQRPPGALRCLALLLAPPYDGQVASEAATALLRASAALPPAGQTVLAAAGAFGAAVEALTHVAAAADGIRAAHDAKAAAAAGKVGAVTALLILNGNMRVLVGRLSACDALVAACAALLRSGARALPLHGHLLASGALPALHSLLSLGAAHGQPWLCDVIGALRALALSAPARLEMAAGCASPLAGLLRSYAALASPAPPAAALRAPLPVNLPPDGSRGGGAGARTSPEAPRAPALARVATAAEAAAGAVATLAFSSDAVEGPLAAAGAAEACLSVLRYGRGAAIEPAAPRP
jgi:hypothetical protein